jgi:hypothetical protein
VTRGASRLAVLHLSSSRMFTPHTHHRRLGRRGNISAHRKATWDKSQSISPKCIHIRHSWPDVAAEVARPSAPKMAGILASTATIGTNGPSSSCQPKPYMGEANNERAIILLYRSGFDISRDVISEKFKGGSTPILIHDCLLHNAVSHSFSGVGLSSGCSPTAQCCHRHQVPSF